MIISVVTKWSGSDVEPTTDDAEIVARATATSLLLGVVRFRIEYEEGELHAGEIREIDIDMTEIEL
jgi:hypothetical protein